MKPAVRIGEAPVLSGARPDRFALTSEMPARARNFPQLRFMGSKHRLLPWLHEVLQDLEFDTALDAFSGSGCVGYLLKCMGKSVTCNDSLNFTYTIAAATVENSRATLTAADIDLLLEPNRKAARLIRDTFKGIFFDATDLRFLDNIWANLQRLSSGHKRQIALSALIRACVKRQPRGVFTVAGDPDRYKDGRRDLRLSIKEHFLENVAAYNSVVFDNGRKNRALRSDVYALAGHPADLVYLDPPYVPRSDDNCYIKRYHFLEGLSSYWEGAELVPGSRVKKLRKPFTPFGYRRTAIDAFDRLVAAFQGSTLVLSYSSNGFPDLPILVQLMRRHKNRVRVHQRAHRYHFGTHAAVVRNLAAEYLIVGR